VTFHALTVLQFGICSLLNYNYALLTWFTYLLTTSTASQFDQTIAEQDCLSVKCRPPTCAFSYTRM